MDKTAFDEKIKEYKIQEARGTTMVSIGAISVLILALLLVSNILSDPMVFWVVFCGGAIVTGTGMIISKSASNKITELYLDQIGDNITTLCQRVKERQT
jgi:hypothetical protein